MRGVFGKLVTVMSGLLISGMAFAQDGETSSAAGLIAIGAGLAIGLGTFGAASGQGKAAAAALDGMARNPNAKGEVFAPFIIALAFMELQAFLALAIAFTLAGKF